MTGRIEVVRVESDSSTPSWEITVYRMSGNSYYPDYKPPASDLPVDVRDGLRAWLDGAS